MHFEQILSKNMVMSQIEIFLLPTTADALIIIEHPQSLRAKKFQISKDRPYSLPSVRPSTSFMSTPTVVFS